MGNCMYFAVMVRLLSRDRKSFLMRVYISKCQIVTAKSWKNCSYPLGETDMIPSSNEKDQGGKKSENIHTYQIYI